MSTAIINMALDLLDEEVILSSDDNRTCVRWMNRNYAPLRDSLLRMHPWNFAKRRAQIAAAAEAPPFGFRFAYPVPTECLRVLPLYDLGGRNGRPTDFSVEGGSILTNAGAPLRVMFIARVTDDGAFDAIFVQLLAATLATRAAQFITGKTSYAERVGQIAADLRMQAQMVNALEGNPEQSIDDDWVLGRQIGVHDAGDASFGYSDGGWLS